MRRSKANPAKYAKNYRKISQRHMTRSSDDVKSLEKEEMNIKQSLADAEKVMNLASVEPVNEKPAALNENGSVVVLEDGADLSNALILPNRKKKKKSNNKKVGAF